MQNPITTASTDRNSGHNIDKRLTPLRSALACLTLARENGPYDWGVGRSVRYLHVARLATATLPEPAKIRSGSEQCRHRRWLGAARLLPAVCCLGVKKVSFLTQGVTKIVVTMINTC